MSDEPSLDGLEPQTLALRHEPRGVLHVTLSRPEARNAMSLVMVAELEVVLDAVLERRDVRVLVLRGAGGTSAPAGTSRTWPRPA